MKPHRGTMVLVFGILGLVCCIPFVFSILAWVFGDNDLKEMAAGRMDPSGEGLTKAGKIMGIIGLCLQVLSGIVAAIGAAAGWFVTQTTGGMPGR
jgi:hypothetical protein